MSEQHPTVVMYGTETCPYCTAARMLLKKKGVEYEEILVSRDAERRAEMERLSGRYTVPQIFIDDEPIGGFDDLYALDREGRLDELLGIASTS
jgi:glutaredoxin 3